MEPRTEVIFKPLSEDFGPEHGPDIEPEPVDMSQLTPDVCVNWCRIHAIVLNDLRICMLNVALMKGVLEDIFRRGIIDLDETLHILKVLTTNTSLVKCDGTFLIGYMYFWRKSVNKKVEDLMSYAASLMPQLLFNHQKEAKRQNELKGHPANMGLVHIRLGCVRCHVVVKFD